MPCGGGALRARSHYHDKPVAFGDPHDCTRRERLLHNAGTESLDRHPTKVLHPGQ
jgi:hypothetical protein